MEKASKKRQIWFRERLMGTRDAVKNMVKKGEEKEYFENEL